ncbi:hypothetical protein C4K24_5829 [Pseudomonas chlororaphis subsp. aurantiaca]|nr:hypothetical protein C4K24_5829 [Pseudomonas chlororaphis subsp. aurantiaca]AZD82466.1 hypothetical protein C4K15_5944 [Pseudomonas chlororaphis subsp. aurantiaca]AZE01819.1 hypothetical protein C4K12_5997 [Pseudomonas chlororaphis subsp. aureofaciens]AZE14120.1 hypothetical protein C4K10_5885 [Pseudomonas chlororaphis subsp. aureofaciens]
MTRPRILIRFTGGHAYQARMDQRVLEQVVWVPGKKRCFID